MAIDEPPSGSAQPAEIASAPKPTSAMLVWWMVERGLTHRAKCLRLLVLQLMKLLLGLAGISLVGVGVDVILHASDRQRPAPHFPLGLGSLLGGHSAWNQLLLVAGGIIAFALIQAVLRNAAIMAQARLVQAIMIELRSAVYDKLQRLSFRFFDGNESGSIINRATGDVGAIATFAQFAVIQIVILIIALVVNLIYMVQIHPMLTLVAMGTTPLLVVSSVLYSKIVRPGYDQNRKHFDELILGLSENVQGQHVIKGFARERMEIAKFHKANNQVRDQQRWLFQRISLYSAVIHTLTQVNMVVVLSYGGYLVIRGQLNLGTGLLVFTTLLQQFSAQVTAVAGVADTMQQSVTAAERVHEVLWAPVEVTSRPGAIALRRAQGAVQFDHVTFGYHKNEPVLHDVSFEVGEGQCVAIMGATGSGKSALLSLIPRFYDASAGAILLDGVDIRELNLDDLRRNIGLVFQESFLFSNTVAANIAFGHPQATREQIVRAAKVAAAHDFIMNLEKGYDTVIGEQGSDLSGGQRQRLAIARAVLLEPAILLLDDATAAIDPETEHEILQAMDNVMKGRTTFVVANRLSTLRRADLVLVLERGRIVQMGTHQELVNSDGHYRQIAQLQGADAESKRLLRAALPVPKA